MYFAHVNATNLSKHFAEVANPLRQRASEKSTSRYAERLKGEARVYICMWYM